MALTKAFFICAGAGISLLAGVNAAYVFGTADQMTITVSDKERIVETDSDGQATSKYLIFTDKETFENTDSLLRLKFNSSDLQGSLKAGQTYRCDVYGWRIPVLSAYRNLVKCDNVTP